MEQLIVYPVPEWINILFLVTIPLPVILTILLAGGAFTPWQSGKVYRVVTLFFVVYIAYVTIMGFSGLFRKASFPPIVLIFTTLPFILFLFIYVTQTSLYRAFVQHVSLDKLVLVHIFRLIGAFFIILALHNALPKWFAFAAGLGDVFTAISAIVVSRAVKQKNRHYKIITRIWNGFGLVDILFTAISANVITRISMNTGIMGVDTLAVFPFWYIPALAPPIIIFLHYTIYKKMNTFN